MKIYIFNAQGDFEFLHSVDVELMGSWASTATDIPYPSEPPEGEGKSWAWDPHSKGWDQVIEDWRHVTFWDKNDSTDYCKGDVGPKPEDRINVAPPDREHRYVWDDKTEQWNLYVEMVDPKVILKQYEDGIQEFIDKVAQARGYDNGYTCASYFQDINPRYAHDAEVFKIWRSRVWTLVNEMLNAYSSEIGEATEIPAAALAGYPTVQDVINSLPVICWED